MSRMSGSRQRLLEAANDNARAVGLDDADRRELQEIVTGKASCSNMTDLELCRVLRAMHAAAGRDRIAGGPRYRKIWALWLSAWHLGMTPGRSEAALAALVNRRTGLDAAAWAHDPALSAKVVENLKAWLARPVDRGGAGVDWSAWPGPDGPTDNPRARVIEAQWRILRPLAAEVAEIALVEASADALKDCIAGLSPASADAFIRRIGECIRAAPAGDAT